MRITFVYLILLISCFSDPKIRGKVIAIKDGDTIEVLSGKTKTKVRLNEIDCPELGQDFGQKAKKLTSDLCFDKNVTVLVKGKDYFGRTLGEVILPDKRNLNYVLVEEGLAWHFKKYSKNATLKKLEEDARRKKKGLWSMNNAVPPWEFRRNIKNKRKLDNKSIQF